MAAAYSVHRSVLDRLRQTIEHLAAIERPSASAGEREAAEWIRSRLAEEGCAARIETERSSGGFWWPLALLSAAAAAAGALAPRRGAQIAGALAAAGIADDVSAGPHVTRRLLPRRTTANVVAEAGDPGAPRTIVLVAHHDAAHGGLIFDPRPMETFADRFPAAYDKINTSPRAMLAVVAGPLMLATGARRLRTAGTLFSAGSMLAFLDIAARKVVPGANDNLSAVAVLLELARRLREQPVDGVRVLLVSTGSEESFMEGMRGFARRHFPQLDPATTEVVCIDTVGSPELVLIEGEGMLRMRDYPEATKERLADAARQAGVHLRRGLRLGFATDGLIALKAGFPSASIGSVTRYRFPSNYHSPKDIPENLHYETIGDCVELCDAFVRQASSARARATASSGVDSSPA
jgi:hypothetical protein